MGGIQRWSELFNSASQLKHCRLQFDSVLQVLTQSTPLITMGRSVTVDSKGELKTVAKESKFVDIAFNLAEKILRHPLIVKRGAALFYAPRSSPNS